MESTPTARCAVNSLVGAAYLKVMLPSADETPFTAGLSLAGSPLVGVPGEAINADLPSQPIYSELK